MAELLRSETNLKPSELKAAYKRSQHIDALLDKEREERQQEIQILTLGKFGCFHGCIASRKQCL